MGESTTNNSTDSKQVFDHHPTCSRRGGASCSCRASLAAQEGDERCEVSYTGRHRIDAPYCKDCGRVFTLPAAASSPPPAEPPPGNVLCKCGHRRSAHQMFSDHDECVECEAREDAVNDGLCCEFRPAEPRQEGEQAREVQCADCLTWFNPDTNHTCRQQVQHNQRNAK